MPWREKPVSRQHMQCTRNIIVSFLAPWNIEAFVKRRKVVMLRERNERTFLNPGLLHDDSTGFYCDSPDPFRQMLI